MAVAPPAGAWIETKKARLISVSQVVAPPAGAWIETGHAHGPTPQGSVAPPAGAWIETGEQQSLARLTARRSPRGSVD